jgi:hypothetical protein
VHSTVSILVFLVVTPCELMGRYQRFGGIYCHLHGVTSQNSNINIFTAVITSNLTVHCRLKTWQFSKVSIYKLLTVLWLKSHQNVVRVFYIFPQILKKILSGSMTPSRLKDIYNINTMTQLWLLFIHFKGNNESYFRKCCCWYYLLCILYIIWLIFYIVIRILFNFLHVINSETSFISESLLDVRAWGKTCDMIKYKT